MISFKQKSCDAKYARNSKLRKEDIRQIKEWLEKQPHLPKVSDYMILQFYEVSDYSLLKTKTLIDGHYKFKNDAPELFVGRDLDKERFNIEFFETWYHCRLPVTNNGMPFVYNGLKSFDSSKFSWESFVTMIIKANLVSILSDESIGECSWILDGEGVGLGHLAAFRLSITRDTVNYLQTYIPVKLCKIFVIRLNTFAEKLYLLVKQFFNEEMNQKVCVLSDPEKLFDHIPKHCVPEELGGSLPKTRSEINEIEKVKMAALNDAAMQEMQLKSDENKRIGNSDANFNAAASFRRIEID